MHFNRALYKAAYFTASAKAWCPCGPDALVNMSVFCADLRLEFGEKTITGLSVPP